MTAADSIVEPKRFPRSSPQVHGKEVWILSQRTTGKPAPARSLSTDLLAQHAATKTLVPLPLERTLVDARLDGLIARVQLANQYHNPYNETIDATYVFPLPGDAALTDFILTIGTRKIRGMVRERAEAERLYRAASAQGFKASLLQANEDNLFTQTLSNLAPDSRIDITLEYVQAVAPHNGLTELTIPFAVGGLPNSPEKPGAPLPPGASNLREVGLRYLAPDERSRHKIELSLEVNAPTGITAVASPSHKISVTQTPGAPKQARISLAAGANRVPNRDLVIRLSHEPATPIAHFVRQGGHFLALLPSSKAIPPKINAIDWNGLRVNDLESDSLPGGTLLMGRCDGPTPANITLPGGESLPVHAQTTDGPAAIWAHRRIQTLSKRGAPAKEIVEVSMTHGVLSPATTQLVLDASEASPGLRREVQQAVPIPRRVDR